MHASADVFWGRRDLIVRVTVAPHRLSHPGDKTMRPSAPGHVPSGPQVTRQLAHATGVSPACCPGNEPAPSAVLANMSDVE